jgi:hypothetical protein
MSKPVQNDQAHHYGHDQVSNLGSLTWERNEPEWQ